MESDRQYFQRRAAEELDAAQRAKSASARQRHQTLAEQYAERVRAEAPELGVD
jgi:hypothetical protein